MRDQGRKQATASSGSTGIGHDAQPESNGSPARWARCP